MEQPASPTAPPVPTGQAASALGLRVGLTFKILGAAALSIALVAVILALSFARDVRELLETELTRRGRMAALSLANTSTNMVFAQDMTGLDTLAKATLADVPGAAYVIVRDELGHILAEAATEDLGTARPEAVELGQMDLGSRLLEKTAKVGDREMLHLVTLVTFKGKALAQYLDPLGLDTATETGAGTAGLKVLGSAEIGFPTEQLTRQIGAASRRSMLIAAVIFAACLLVMYPLARFVTRPLVDLSRAALGIARGDLRQDVDRSGNDEVADLGRSFGHMVSELQSMLRELREAAAAMERESNNMLASATRQATMATQQSVSVTEMNASVKEIAQTSQAATDQAEGVISVAENAEESSRAGAEVVEEAVSSTSQVEQSVAGIASRLDVLVERVAQIGSTIDTVRDLAQQSNVLALNAAIEASRAGDAGKSFSVIAHEMRTLAEQSAGAASEVPKLLGDIVASTKAAAAATGHGREKARSTAELARRAGESIGNLTAVCRDSAAAARQIAESSRQTATGVNEIVGALSQLARAAEGSVEGSVEMRQAAERLKSVSARLSEIVERYRS
ncbi:MAG TPA: methyl-accepting chemotaxis protein [Anaeromyxobacteraceae bacterium]|nr:methyl-accepting chemotaxis protein [Anaeromyxobacteraceae bacterium]